MAENHYYFENLTVAPYCRELIDVSLLEPETRNFLDEFHQKCLRLLSPLLKDDARALAYLTRQC